MNPQKKETYPEIFETHFSMTMLCILFFNLVYIIISFYVKFLLNLKWTLYLNPLMYLLYLRLSYKVLALKSRSDHLSLMFLLFSLALFNISLFLFFLDSSIVESIVVLILTFLVFIFSGINIFKKL